MKEGLDELIGSSQDAAPAGIVVLVVVCDPFCHSHFMVSPKLMVTPVAGTKLIPFGPPAMIVTVVAKPEGAANNSKISDAASNLYLSFIKQFFNVKERK
jgi:hypothetical protein